MIQAPIAEGRDSFRNVYSYMIDGNLQAIHERVEQTGIQDIAIGVQLYSIVDNQGNPEITIQELLDEIEWARQCINGSVGLIIYNDTTRVGYDYDGIYRYYRNWNNRYPVLQAIAESVDYVLVDMAEVHYSSEKDLITYLLALKGLLGEVGIYDGDAAEDLDYEVLDSMGIYVWSNVYIGETAYLNSECGWDYEHLILCSYLASSPLCQPDSGEDMDLIYRLIRERDFSGYNIICTYEYEGIMPDWALRIMRSHPVPNRVWRENKIC